MATPFFSSPVLIIRGWLLERPADASGGHADPGGHRRVRAPIVADAPPDSASPEARPHVGAHQPLPVLYSQLPSSVVPSPYVMVVVPLPDRALHTPVQRT